VVVLPGPGTAWALGCCLLLAIATWGGSRTVDRASSAALAVAGGLLVAMVVLDLAPDALADGAEQGIPAVVLVAAAAGVGLALWWLVRSSSGAVSSRWRVPATAGALAAHRVVEGATLGLAGATDQRAGALVLVALVLHGGCEGAALEVTAGHVRCSRRTTAGYVALLCLAPVPGVVAEGFADAAGLRPWATAAVCGVLLTTGIGNLRGAGRGLSRPRSAVLGTAGAGLLALSLHLAA
jgi:zinc transporter ZupT